MKCLKFTEVIATLCKSLLINLMKQNPAQSSITGSDDSYNLCWTKSEKKKSTPPPPILSRLSFDQKAYTPRWRHNRKRLQGFVVDRTDI